MAMKKYLILFLTLCMQTILYAQSEFAITGGPYLQSVSENENYCMDDQSGCSFMGRDSTR